MSVWHLTFCFFTSWYGQYTDDIIHVALQCRVRFFPQYFVFNSCNLLLSCRSARGGTYCDVILPRATVSLSTIRTRRQLPGERTPSKVSSTFTTSWTCVGSPKRNRCLRSSAPAWGTASWPIQKSKQTSGRMLSRNSPSIEKTTLLTYHRHRREGSLSLSNARPVLPPRPTRWNK